MPPFVLSPVIKVGGAALTNAQLQALVSVEVDLGLNLVGRTTLKFIEAAYDLIIQPKFTLGTEVTIGFPGNVDVFKGLVTGVSLDQEVNYGPAVTELTITVDDGAYKFGQDTQNTAFLNSSYSDVITKMLSGTGLQSDIQSTSPVHPYLLQTGSNLAYLDWMVGRCGMVWWVDYGKLMVKPAGTSTATNVLKLGDTLQRLSTRASGLHTGKVTVTGWDPAQQAAIANVASATTSPESTLVGKFPGRTAPSGTGVKVSGASPLTAAEAKQVSETMLAESTAAAVTTRGTCLANGAIKPATTVDVQNAGVASGKYLVTRVQHTYNSGGFQTHFTAGPIRPEGLVDLLSGPPQTSGGTISGLMVGVVTNINDSEGKLGRVKVKFPTIGSDIESEWARVVSLGGGPKRGVVFQPEVNDEVLVGFEQGDTRRPVVLGGLFSDKNGLPTTDNVDSGAVAYRRINSRTGHLIELADGTSADKKHILLKTSNGHQIRVGEDEMTLEVKDKPITITNGSASIKFANNGDITIEGTNVTIKADGAFKVEAKSGVELKSNAAAKLEGAMINIKAQGMNTVEAGGIMAVKGATVAIN